jgi:hypothetical protein
VKKSTYRWHVTQMTPEAAMEWTRRVHGLADKPHIGIGWIPYNFLVTYGAVSQWATYTETEFDDRCRRDHLQLTHWTPWENGIRSAFLDIL